MTTIKLRQIGNSVGVILPKAALEKLNLDAGDEMTFDETNKGFSITIKDAEADRLWELAQKIMEEDHDVLRALAK